MTDAATRRAALALHGLSHEDRDWALERLTASERAKVSGFLEELAELGFPRDASELMREIPPDAETEQREPEVEIIDSAAPRAVHRLLRHEHLATQALVLDYHAWRWRKPVMRRLGRSRSRALRQAIEKKKHAVTDAVRRSVIRAFAAAIHSGSDGTAQPNLSDENGSSR